MPDPTASNPLLHVVLFQPEIPQNTGNIGRLCAYTGSRLHLIHPLGFALSEKHIRRSGMDYWDSLDLVEHADWNAFWQQRNPDASVWLLSTRGKQSHWSAPFRSGDYLLFGNEGHGCPDAVHDAVGQSHVVKIPRLVSGLRSLNLSTSVGITVYEALRSIKEIVNFDEY